MAPRPNSYSPDESADAKQICRNDPALRQALVPYRVAVDRPSTDTPALPMHSLNLLGTGHEAIRRILWIRRAMRRAELDMTIFSFIRAPFGAFGWGSSRRLQRRRSMPILPHTHLYQVWSVSLIVVRNRRPDWGVDVTCVSGLVIRRTSDRSRYSFWFDSEATAMSFIIVWD